MRLSGALLKEEPGDDFGIQLRARIAKLRSELSKYEKMLAIHEGLTAEPEPERYDYAGMRLGDAALTILRKWNRPATYGELIDEMQVGGALQGKLYPAEQARKAIDLQVKLGSLKHAKGSKPVSGSKPRRINENAEFERRWKSQIVELA